MIGAVITKKEAGVKSTSTGYDGFGKASGTQVGDWRVSEKAFFYGVA
jgi:hypothetical protein